jgi:hypothetical protein
MGLAMDDLDACVIGEGCLEMGREVGIELDQQEFGASRQAPQELAAVHPLTGAELDDSPRRREIEALGDALDERAQAWNDGGDLKGAFTEAFQEQKAHRSLSRRIVTAR